MRRVSKELGLALDRAGFDVVRIPVGRFAGMYEVEEWMPDVHTFIKERIAHVGSPELPGSMNPLYMHVRWRDVLAHLAENPVLGEALHAVLTASRYGAWDADKGAIAHAVAPLVADFFTGTSYEEQMDILRNAEQCTRRESDFDEDMEDY